MIKKIFFFSTLLCVAFSYGQYKIEQKIKLDTTKNTKRIPEVIVSYDDYESVNVTTGDLGCSNVVPRYDYSIKTFLRVKNHGNLDMVIKLINLEDNIASRMVYIQKNSSFEIKNIPQGKYVIKEAHGESWKQKIIDGQCVGVFTKDSFYRQSQKIVDFFIVKKDQGDYEEIMTPSYEIELGVRIPKNSTQKKNNSYKTNTISSVEFNR